MSASLRVLVFVAFAAACSDSPAEPAAPVEPPAPIETTAPAPPEQRPPTEAEASEAETAPEEPELQAAPVRAPDSRVLPELSSVRWGPDRRDAFESLGDLDAMIRADLGRPARVAVRMRARHGRERMTLAVVLALKENHPDLEPEFVERLLQFDGAVITDEVLAVDRREGEVDDAAGAPCRCEADLHTELLLVRVVHGDTNRIDYVKLPADVCTGRNAELSLADFDRDGRVEVRSIVSYNTDVACGVQDELFTRMYVVDIADLVLQVDIATDHERMHYFAQTNEHTRARFTALDEDEHPDIQVVGRGTYSDDDTEGSAQPYAVRQAWLYDITSDSWVKQVEPVGADE